MSGLVIDIRGDIHESYLCHMRKGVLCNKLFSGTQDDNGISYSSVIYLSTGLK